MLDIGTIFATTVILGYLTLRACLMSTGNKLVFREADRNVLQTVYGAKRIADFLYESKDRNNFGYTSRDHFDYQMLQKTVVRFLASTFQTS